MNRDNLKVGHVYRGKRQRKNIFSGLTDDRIIVYMNENQIQYDSYFVKYGKHYPITTVEKFLKWAKEEVKER